VYFLVVVPLHVTVSGSTPFADSRLPVYERLQKHGQALAAKLEVKRQEVADKEVEGVTFKPEISDMAKKLKPRGRSSSVSRSQTRSRSSSRCGTCKSVPFPAFLSFPALWVSTWAV
jgi:hypothetical protein